MRNMLMLYKCNMMETNGQGKSSRKWLSLETAKKFVVCARSQVSIPAHWKSEEARSVVLSLHVSLQVSLNTFVCRLVGKVLSYNRLYVPRWRKGSKLSACCKMDCTGVYYRTPYRLEATMLSYWRNVYKHPLAPTKPLQTMQSFY